MYSVPDQTGRTAVVTGANSGTGKEATARLANAGAHVIMAVRTIAKGESAKAEILRKNPHASLEVRYIDLADLSTVHAFAKTLRDEGSPLNLLLNNAGVMAPPKRMTTADNFELQFGSNFLGPFALTNLLLPLLLKAKKPRVATMSSTAAGIGRIRFEDLQFTRGYRPFRAYSQSKLANLLAGQHLATIADQRGWNLLSTVAHPGFTRTNLQTAGANLGRDKPRPNIFSTERTLIPFQDVEQGTEPLLYAAADPNARQGAYYGPDRMGLTGPSTQVKPPRSARGRDLAASLWSVAEDLTGTSLPPAGAPTGGR